MCGTAKFRQTWTIFHAPKFNCKFMLTNLYWQIISQSSEIFHDLKWDLNNQIFSRDYALCYDLICICKFAFMSNVRQTTEKIFAKICTILCEQSRAELSCFSSRRIFWVKAFIQPLRSRALVCAREVVRTRGRASLFARRNSAARRSSTIDRNAKQVLSPRFVTSNSDVVCSISFRVFTRYKIIAKKRCERRRGTWCINRDGDSGPRPFSGTLIPISSTN